MIAKQSKTKQKEQKGGFLDMPPDTLGASLWGNLLTGKNTIKASKSTIRASKTVIVTSHGQNSIRADQDFYCHLIL